MMALAGAALAAPIALAQVPAQPQPPARPPATMSGGSGSALRPVASMPPLSPAGSPAATATATTAPSAARPLKDGQLFEASTALPAPTIPDQVSPPPVAMPVDGLEPYLLTRDAGPFMVMAKTFRGPDAERWALALVLELRNEYQLPAWILRTRDFPMRSYIRDVPPTAINEVRKPYLTEPEKSRTHDEAVVLVGNEKTLKGSEELLHQVKKIKPKCLNEKPSIYHWREGLSKALRTTNPFVPAQELFPQKPDPFVMKLNGGAHSVFHCPGRYTLQVAEFGGRATFLSNERTSKNPLDSDSPLERAFDDAEKLAETLAKDPDIRKTGALPYVYHNLTSSKVMIGAFNAPNDPGAAKLRDTLLKLAVPLSDKKKAGTMIVPAPYLTDVEVLKTSAQQQQ
jgi:hypothetical protein